MMNSLYTSRIIVFVFLCITLWTTPTNPEDLSAAAPILKKLQFSTREDIARFIGAYAKKSTSVEDLSMFSSLLDNKEIILSDSDLTEPIQVRDIAFVCIQEITGTWFIPRPQDGTYPVKVIVSYRSKADGEFWRFSIPAFSEENFAEVKLNIEYWIDGFEKGIKEGERLRKTKRRLILHKRGRPQR